MVQRCFGELKLVLVIREGQGAELLMQRHFVLAVLLGPQISPLWLLSFSQQKLMLLFRVKPAEDLQYRAWCVRGVNILLNLTLHLNEWTYISSSFPEAC